MISIILLALAIALLIFTDAMLFKKVVDLEEIVDSHWDATQREADAIWGQLHDREDGE